MEDNYDDIRKAIEENNIAFIQSQPSERIKESNLFSFSIRNGSIDVIEAFVKHGVDVTQHHPLDPFPIEGAAARGDIDIIKLLLANGCTIDPEENVDAGYAVASSPLNRAVHNNKYDAATFLLENGADQNIRTHSDNSSPLYYAVENQNEEMIELLLEYKPDFKWNRNKYAISLAAKLGNATMLEKLLKASRVKMKAVKSFYYRDSGMYSPLEEAVINEHFDCVKLLIDYGANPNAGSHGDLNWTPVTYAIKSGNLKILKYLLENGGCFETVYKNINSRSPNATYVNKPGDLQYRANESGIQEMIDYIQKQEEEIFSDV